MSKPKKLTEGHSSGPQGYWDSISDANKEAEIERLQAEIIRLSKANKRLRKTMVSLALRVWKPQSQKGAE